MPDAAACGLDEEAVASVLDGLGELGDGGQGGALAEAGPCAELGEAGGGLEGVLVAGVGERHEDELAALGEALEVRGGDE